MKQKITYGILAILVLTAIMGCTSEKPQDKTTPQFEIYYTFGVGSISILDTKNNLYVKDMVCNESKKYNFQLTETERSIIYNSIIENDLFNIKDEFTQNCDEKGICIEQMPSSSASLKITADGKTKTIKMSSNYINYSDPELKRFKNVLQIIDEIIYQKEKDKNIEQPGCGYM